MQPYPGLKGEIEGYEGFGKIEGARIHEMVPALGLSGNAAIEVFNRPGHPGEGVGFQLGQADDAVRLQDAVGDQEAPGSGVA